MLDRYSDRPEGCSCKYVYASGKCQSGTPDLIISSWGPYFISEFWSEIYRMLKVSVKLSTAYLETNGQLENVNEELTVHINVYSNYH